MLAFLQKLKDNITAILGVIVAILFGWLMIEKNRKDSAEALLENQKSKEELNKIDQDIANKAGQADAEEIRRLEILKGMEDDKKAVSNDELVKYFNDPKNKPS